MKKLIFLVLIVSFFLELRTETNSFQEKIWSLLEKGNYLVFIRHSLIPRSGTPKGLDLEDCTTQRNLNQEGIE